MTLHDVSRACEVWGA